MGSFWFVYLVALFVFYCYLCRVAQFYAIRNGRESIRWFLFAFFFSPVLAGFCVFMLGETDEYRRNRIIEEEVWRRSAFLNVYCDRENTTVPKSEDKEAEKSEDLSLNFCMGAYCSEVEEKGEHTSQQGTEDVDDKKNPYMMWLAMALIIAAILIGIFYN